MIDAVSFMSFGDPDLVSLLFARHNCLRLFQKMALSLPLQILMIIEDKLREIYRKSQLLSEYLMSVGVTKMDEVVAVLSKLTESRLLSLMVIIVYLAEMEANDIPLLLSVASTHSPEVASRYGVSLK